jgi:hypothetical protein
MVMQTKHRESTGISIISLNDKSQSAKKMPAKNSYSQQGKHAVLKQPVYNVQLLTDSFLKNPHFKYAIP